MKQSDLQELEDIRNDLQYVINQLKEISTGVKKDFVGIGSENCSTAIDREIEKLKKAKKHLSNLEDLK